jgi:hypothetical protein
MAKIPYKAQRLTVFSAVALLLTSFGHAQTGLAADAAVSVVAQAIPQTVEDVLRVMSDKAAIVFAGQVTAVRPHEDGAAASGYVEIDFHVDEAIRGCASGETYTLREWAGLWAGNPHRYRVGQHLLMLLHAPGLSGLSSPVGGMDGMIPIRAGGAAPASAAASTISPSPVADLRWLGTELLHPVSYMLHASMASTQLTLAQQMAPHPADEVIAEGSIANRSSIPVQQASVAALVKLLTSWQQGGGR